MALTAGEIGARDAALRDQVQQEPVTYTDDTGWRVAGKQAILMAFEGTGCLPDPGPTQAR